MKKPRDTQKVEGSIIEVSDSESMLSDNDDFLVVATKVTPQQPVVFSPLTAETQVEVGPLLNIFVFHTQSSLFWKGETIETFCTCTNTENSWRWQLSVSG